MSNAHTVTQSKLHLDLPGPSTVAPLDIARQAILAPSGLDDERIASVLGSVMGYSVDYADLYFQLSRDESWSLEDGIVKDGAHSIEQGVGVRALAGEKTGFAYSDEIVMPALTKKCGILRIVAKLPLPLLGDEFVELPGLGRGRQQRKRNDEAGEKKHEPTHRCIMQVRVACRLLPKDLDGRK